MNDFSELPRRQWIRPSEAAGFLCLSERTIRRMCERGDLVAFRVGDNQRQPLRISRQSILDFVRRAIEAYQLETGADIQ